MYSHVSSKSKVLVATVTHATLCAFVSDVQRVVRLLCVCVSIMLLCGSILILIIIHNIIAHWFHNFSDTTLL